jgi:lysophospholipase L1-like esterase
MYRTVLRRMAALVAVALALASVTAAACPPDTRPKRYYLALGDSIPYGFQTAKAVAGRPPADFVGYPELLMPRLRQLNPRTTLVNYSCPGESTTTYLQPCVWRASGHALHDDYSGAQRDAALSFLRRHRGQVSPITVALNGNDINEYLASCPPGDLACLQAGASAATAAYGARLLTLLRELRAAAPDALIVVVGAYNPNVGAFGFTDPLFRGVNAAQAAAAAAVDGRFADPFPVFNPAGDEAAETAAICRLTLICTARDGHPSDAGYQALADIVWQTYRARPPGHR